MNKGNFVRADLFFWHVTKLATLATAQELRTQFPVWVAMTLEKSESLENWIAASLGRGDWNIVATRVEEVL